MNNKDMQALVALFDNVKVKAALKEAYQIGRTEYKEQVLKTAFPSTTKKPKGRAELIEHMLNDVEMDLLHHERTSDFIESLRDWFDRAGFLTDKQFEALERKYEEI